MLYYKNTLQLEGDKLNVLQLVWFGKQLYISGKVTVNIMSLLNEYCSWSYGVVLWEILTYGKYSTQKPEYTILYTILCTIPYTILYTIFSILNTIKSLASW